MAGKEYYVTQEKYSELKEELEHLTGTRRREVAEDLERARSMGDLSENAEYDQARQAQAELEDRINQIKEILKYAEIVDHTESDTIEVGSRVVLKKKGNKTKQEYAVVGSEEADMKERKISYASPLGSALMGRSEGESFTFESPGGEIAYKIVKVE